MATIDAIKADIETKVARGVSTCADEIYDYAQMYMDRFYGEYKPKRYVRTYSVGDSLTKNVGSNFAEIYFDIGKQGHRLGTWSEQDVQDSVMAWGTHGGAEGGTAVWTSTMAQIGNPEKKLVEHLKSAGLPIK